MTEVLMFPGQGSQHVGMGGALFDHHAGMVQLASEILGWDVRRMCLDNPGGLLDDTRYTQPAVYVVNALWCRSLTAWSWPDIVLGHSLGEYSALEAAGVLGFEDGLRLVKARGELSARVPGVMTAVLGLDEGRIRDTLVDRGVEGVEVANYNTSRQIVLAGPEAAIVRAEEALISAGAFDVRRLTVSGPFHSRYMNDVADEWEKVLNTVEFGEASFPVVANRTARPYEPGEHKSLLAEHIRLPVRWHESINWIVGNYQDVRFHEAGGRDILLRMLRQISPEHAAQARRNQISAFAAIDPPGGP
jgi:malonyl CoA-acyl carrier protein transacylase